MLAIGMALLSGCGGGTIGGAEFTPTDTGGEGAGDTSSAVDSGADSGDTGGPPEDTVPDLRPPGSCEPTIPADATAVDRELDDDGDALLAWVCRGATVSAGGRKGAYFVDPGGELVLSGSEGRAWVKASATVAIFLGPNEVWAEEGATVHVEAEDVTVNWCPTLAFAGGPEQGCR